MSRDPIWGNEPIQPWDLIREEIGRLLSGQRRAAEGGAAAGPDGLADGWVPPLDVVELDDEIQVRIDLPGLSAATLELSVTGTTLLLRGRREIMVEPQSTARILQQERPSGSFARQINLPCEVNADAVQADLRDGVLEVRLPKAKALPSRNIPIRSV